MEDGRLSGTVNAQGPLYAVVIPFGSPKRALLAHCVPSVVLLVGSLGPLCADAPRVCAGFPDDDTIVLNVLCVYVIVTLTENSFITIWMIPFSCVLQAHLIANQLYLTAHSLTVVVHCTLSSVQGEGCIPACRAAVEGQVFTV